MPNSWQDDPADYIGNAIGVPVKITSGRRTPQHNALVGGVPNSDHLQGQAYDFVPQGMSMGDAASRLRASGIPTTKILNEGNHVHVSYPQQGNMPQNISDDDLLKALTGGTPNAAPDNAPAAQLSDEQILAALTGSAGKKAAPVSSAPAPSAKKGFQPKFGFTEDMTAKIPFAKDVMSAGAAGLDMLGDAIDGKPEQTLNGLIAGNKPRNFSNLYQSHMADINRQQAEYEAQNPNLGHIATGLSFLTAGPAKGMAAIRQTLPEMAKAGAKGGAIIGGLFGLGTPSENDSVGDRIKNGLVGAGTGLIAGGALPIAGAGVAATGQKVGQITHKLFPSIDEIATKRAKGIIDKFAGGPISPQANEIVPGSKPTLAEATGNPGVANLQKQITQLNPNSPILARLSQNNEARLAHLDTATGSAADIEAAQKARDAAATAQRKALFSSSAAPVDTAPITDTIKSILSGPSGARPAVKSAMADAEAILANNGKRISDPETLYQSVRKGINDLISGKDLTKAYGAQAASQLITVRDALDDAIEADNPGFKKYLSDYATASTPIDAMQFLQGQKLTNDQGVITLHNVQSAIRKLEAQRAAAGIKAGKAVTNAQKSVLENIRDDLLRQGNIDAGRVRGSDTAQNIIQQSSLGLVNGKPSRMSMLLPEVAGGGIGATIGHLSGIPLAPELGGYIGDRIGKFMAVRGAERTAASNDLTRSKLEEILLNPSQYNNPSIPRNSAASLNDIINSSRARASLGIANRLAIMHELGSQKRTNAH